MSPNHYRTDAAEHGHWEAFKHLCRRRAGLIGYLILTGAVVYALRRPDPIPHVFGYHEIFHVLTLVAAGCQYAAIAFYVLPRA